MAIAEISPHLIARSEKASVEKAGEVRVAIHDASRVEWSVTVPLPRGKATTYEIEFELQIPANAFVRHAPWDHLQSYTRLDSPHGTGGDAVTIDALRREVLALAHRLTKISEEFTRHCRLSGSLFNAKAPHPLDVDALSSAIVDAAALAKATRRDLCHERAWHEPSELQRERRLVDEYVSVRLLEFLASSGRSLRTLIESRSPHVASYLDAVNDVDARTADALEQELLYRKERGFLSADPKSLAALERYLDRASQLKKHFQEVLFLEAETFQVAERIHHVVAAFVAVIASTWAFFWQIALANRAIGAGGQIGSGIVLLAILAGVVYAGKDRIKEIGRDWISGRVHRHYAQRVARFRAPARRLPSRDIIASARESFDQWTVKLPDPLNPDSGAKVLATTMRYVQRGNVFPQTELSRGGVTRLKHVFRYDLSPIFSRLDDAMKQVPVLDEATHRVRFIDAPRCYRVPVKVRITTAAGTSEEAGTLVLHKRGLDRIERAGDAHDSDPDLDGGLEPS